LPGRSRALTAVLFFISVLPLLAVNLQRDFYYGNGKTGQCENTASVPEIHPEVVTAYFETTWHKECRAEPTDTGITLTCWNTTFHYFYRKGECLAAVKKLHDAYLREWQLPGKKP
jgi:hypothetical protein